jgi:hypothetical protein
MQRTLPDMHSGVPSGGVF